MENYNFILEKSFIFKICKIIFTFLSKVSKQSIAYKFSKYIFLYLIKISDYLNKLFKPLALYFRESIIYKILSFRLDRWK